MSMRGSAVSRGFGVPGMTVRLVFHTGGGTFWGVEETNWDGAPALADKSFRHDLGGREFDLYYSASHLHMVVLHALNVFPYILVGWLVLQDHARRLRRVRAEESPSVG